MLNTRLHAAMALFAGITSAASFDVASVKINKAQTGPSNISASTPGRFIASNTPVRFVVLYAYHLMDHELVGMPAWTSDTSVDITGQYPSDTTDEQIRAMVQDLLKDRFALEIHHDKCTIPSYDLTLAAKDGHLGAAMKPSTVDCQQWIAEKRPQRDAGGPSSASPTGKRPACMMSAGRRWMAGGSATMPQFTAALQSMVARPVVDKTGLQGEFDIDLKWTLMDDANASNDNPQSDLPSIFTALREQLGLKLDTHQEPFDVIVVDRITQPTAN
jgi:uncharacterized protein (TIGR03435 family)